MTDNIKTPSSVPSGRESWVTLNSKLSQLRPGLDTLEKGRIASPAWNWDAQPCKLTDYTLPVPLVYSDCLGVCTFTAQSQFSASRFFRYHCVRTNGLKTFCVLNKREGFDILNCNWIVGLYIPFLWNCCTVLYIDIAIQRYIPSLY
jgi:hypothetical protein